MRDTLRALQSGPDHAGLHWEVWGRVEARGEKPGRVTPAEMETWIGRMTATQIAPDYGVFFEAWRASFPRSTRWITLTASSRLLVGHGNPSPSEVGLTLHHTWGVPVLPGSSVKGVTSSFAELRYGPEARDDARPERAAWAGPRRDGGRFTGAPGASYKALFGAPDSDDGEVAQRGGVVVHDALLLPPSAEHLPDRRFLVPDVLTVHHRAWYSAVMEGKAPAALPNDWDDPNPVAFLTVRPGCRFLLPLTARGEEAGDLLEVASRLVQEALAEAGLGAKTRRGYGRLVADGVRRDPDGSSVVLGLIDELKKLMGTQGKRNLPHAERVREVLAQLGDRIEGASADDRAAVWEVFGKHIKEAKAPAEIAELKQRLGRP